MSTSHLPTYWIGGSPCSGKSSIAARLAGRFGLQVYSCDDHFPAHQRQADSRQHPNLHSLSMMSWNEIWMRPVDIQVEAVFKVYREEFKMILDDLHSLESGRPILAEGAALLPELLIDLLHDPTKAVWVVPKPDFQLHIFQRDHAE
jgi:2-phosphoglycerate kinase